MRVLGIDPGYALVGLGVLEGNNKAQKLVDYCCVVTSSNQDSSERLAYIYKKVIKYIDDLKPEVVAMEKLFFSGNQKTAMMVSEARGVIKHAIYEKGLDLVEYTPLQIKIAVCGYGRADKRQVQKMLQALLGLKKIIKPDDSADAVAVALCHIVMAKKFENLRA